MAIVLVRTVIIYLALLVTMRVMGKRQLGEMELSEFVVAALIADLAAHPLQDIGIPMINGLVPVFTLFCMEVIISGLSMKSVKLRGVLFGRPSILISHGEIQQSQMRKNRFTLDELTQELRNRSVLDIKSIEYAILETDGQLNIVLMPDKRPATAGDLGITSEDTGYPSIVINDGRVLTDNLDLVGQDTAWLNEKLRCGGFESPREVFLMTVNRAGDYEIVPKEGRE